MSCETARVSSDVTRLVPDAAAAAAPQPVGLAVASVAYRWCYRSVTDSWRRCVLARTVESVAVVTSQRCTYSSCWSHVLRFLSQLFPATSLKRVVWLLLTIRSINIVIQGDFSLHLAAMCMSLLSVNSIEYIRRKQIFFLVFTIRYMKTFAHYHSGVKKKLLCCYNQIASSTLRTQDM